MIVDEATRFRLQQEATEHCMQVWPTIMEFKFAREPYVLTKASDYLGELKASDPLMYEIVMKMLSLRSGVDWSAIRDAVE